MIFLSNAKRAPHLRNALLTLTLHSVNGLLGACTRAPAEPVSAPPAPGPRPLSTVSSLLPVPEAAQRAARVLRRSTEGARAVALPGWRLPPESALLALPNQGETGSTVVLVEGTSAHEGLEAAQRLYAYAQSQGQSPDAAALTHLLGTIAYFPWRYFDGAEWVRTPDRSAPDLMGSPPTLTRREAGGQVLSFHFWIPEGHAGAGMHLSNFRLTPTGLFLDQAPHPERR